MVRLAAPPVEGAANDALIAFLSSALHVPRRAIRIVSGDRGRQKRVAHRRRHHATHPRARRPTPLCATARHRAAVLRYTRADVVADFLIHNTSEILTCAGPAPRVGAAPGRRRLAAQRRDRRASRARSCSSAPTRTGGAAGTLSADAVVLDAAGGAVVPGFVDPHTHVVFAGDRRDELRRRLGGATYAEIAAAGGGIVSSVQRHARGVGRGPGGRHAGPPRRDAALRHDDVRGQERLRAHHRRRAEDAAGDSDARGHARDRDCRRRSWARTRCRVEYRERPRARTSTSSCAR